MFASSWIVETFYGQPATLRQLALDPQGHLTFRLVQGFSGLAIWGLAATFWAIYTGEFRKQLGLQYRTWSGFFPLAALATICALPVVEWLLIDEQTFSMPESFAAFELWAREQEANTTATLLALFKDTSWPAIASNVLVIAVVPAIAEEMFFRGFLMGTLRRVMPGHVAVWLSALIFSLLHFQFYGFISRLFLGAMLGYFYLWSGNLLTSMLAHFLHNFVSLLIALMIMDAGGGESILQDDFAFGPAITFCAACITLGLLYLYYRHSRGRNTMLRYE